PTIVLRESPDAGRAPAWTVEAVAGASGGPRIISGTLEALLRVMIFGQSAGQAVSAPRFHHQWMPDRLLFEKSWLAEPEGRRLADALANMGHQIDGIKSVADVQLVHRAR